MAGTNGRDDVAMTIREMVFEIREDVKGLKMQFNEHLDWGEKTLHEFEAKMVTKDELALADQVKRTARRYLITTLLTLTAVVIAAASLIIGTR